MSEKSKLIEGRTGSWEVVLGLEVHAQVASRSKLFSGAAVGFGAGPNEQVSLVDAANPCVFVDARSLGASGIEAPEVIERNAALMDRLEAIRRAASVAMGLTANLEEAGRVPAVPKVALVAAPTEWTTLSGKRLGAADADIMVRMLSVGQPHRATPITGAVCLAVAARTPGTLPQQLCAGASGAIRIGHPSGTIMVDAAVAPGPDGAPRADHGAVYRSARRLFEGAVLYRTP